MRMENDLAKNIYDLQHCQVLSPTDFIEKNVPSDKLMILVSDVIIRFGIPVHIKGFAYLREAIYMRLKDPKVDMAVTKIIYPSVAKEFNTSAVLVERAIRHAIKVAWTRIDQPSWGSLTYQLFHYEKKPTNAEFIAMIVEYIMLFCKK